jgi:carbon-monoxide dehydrogenase medium subunit
MQRSFSIQRYAIEAAGPIGRDWAAEDQPQAHEEREVKPAPFVYVAPESLDEAVEALREHGSDGKVLAGGQSLVPMMNMRLARPGVLVDVMRVQDLAGIRSNGRISVGAATRQKAVLADAGLGGRFPLIHEALRHVGHVGNRTRGTFGGSIAHADPAAELPAVALALGAEMVVRGPGGQRTVSADDFFVTYYTTALDADELLTEVRLPEQAPSAWAFGEVARRHGDFALSGVALTADVEGGVVSSARIVLFGVSDRPVRASAAEAALAGQKLGDESVAREVGRSAQDGIDFSNDVHISDTYRREASEALVRRAVLDAARTVEG